MHEVTLGVLLLELGAVLLDDLLYVLQLVPLD